MMSMHAGLVSDGRCRWILSLWRRKNPFHLCLKMHAVAGLYRGVRSDGDPASQKSRWWMLAWSESEEVAWDFWKHACILLGKIKRSYFMCDLTACWHPWSYLQAPLGHAIFWYIHACILVLLFWFLSQFGSIYRCYPFEKWRLGSAEQPFLFFEKRVPSIWSSTIQYRNWDTKRQEPRNKEESRGQHKGGLIYIMVKQLIYKTRQGQANDGPFNILLGCQTCRAVRGASFFQVLRAINMRENTWRGQNLNAVR